MSRRCQPINGTRQRERVQQSVTKSVNRVVRTMDKPQGHTKEAQRPINESLRHASDSCQTMQQAQTSSALNRHPKYHMTSRTESSHAPSERVQTPFQGNGTPAFGSLVLGTRSMRSMFEAVNKGWCAFRAVATECGLSWSATEEIILSLSYFFAAAGRACLASTGPQQQLQALVRYQLR